VTEKTTLPPPATLLRHREPALMLATTDAFAGEHLDCTSIDRASWHWPEVLEAAAQTAGLLAGLQGDGLDATAVIAEYRDVHVHAARADGRLRLRAELGRRVLQFRLCRVEVRSADGALLLDGTVALAPGGRMDA
jgi:hypothetical protein